MAISNYRNGWMKFLLDSGFDLKLNQLTIPGTHDTGTWTLNKGSASRCQEMDLKTQLEHGIRFIDIRLVPERNSANNDLMVWHGDENVGSRCDVWFSDIIETCREFLAINKEETIIMSIKNEHDVSYSIFTIALNAFINHELQKNSTEKLFYTSSEFPKLSDSQGKIVLFNRYSGNRTRAISGIPTNDWPNDNKTSEPNQSNMMIQDIFTMAAADQGDKKWTEHIKPFLYAAKNEQNQTSTWWLNFTSTSGSGSPWTFADEINPLLQAWLEKKLIIKRQSFNDSRLGTIIMDFPTPRLIDALILMNFSVTDLFIQSKPFRGNTIRLSNKNAYLGQSYKPGSWNYAQCYFDIDKEQVTKHSLIKVHGYDSRHIFPGDMVMIMSHQFNNDAYVYIENYGTSGGDDGGINLFYDSSLKDENYQHNAQSIQWKVVCKTKISPELFIAAGDILLFESAKRPGCYLLAATDQYLSAQPLSFNNQDAAVEGGFYWVLE